MAAVSNQGTTFNLPNFVGPLFHVSPMDAVYLSMIGGLTGGVQHSAKVRTWQTDDNATPAQTEILEGADPSYQERSRSEVSNVLQIFQYGFEVSYTKRAAVGQLGDWSTRVWSVLGEQPVQDEIARQTMLKVIRAKRDVNYSMLRGTFQNPTDNTSGRLMRGLKSAISSNEVALFSALTDTTAAFDLSGHAQGSNMWTATAHGLAVGDEIQFTSVGTGAEPHAVDTPYWVVAVPTANDFQLSATKGGSVLAGTGSDSSGTWTAKKAQQITKSDIDRLLRETVEGEDPGPLTNPVLICGAYARQRISDIYGYAPESRSIGGLNIESIVTDFTPNLGIVFERSMHPGDLYLVDLSVCAPVFMPIPDKGHFFLEEKPASGASWKYMLYGEIGQEYGPEGWHGKITGSTTA